MTIRIPVHMIEPSTSFIRNLSSTVQELALAVELRDCAAHDIRGEGAQVLKMRRLNRSAADTAEKKKKKICVEEKTPHLGDFIEIAKAFRSEGR